MPGGNQNSPFGKGSGRGKGTGQGGGLHRGGRRPGAGPGGECACPVCGERVAHQPGVPCTQTVCPKCGRAMTRG
jgi:hypothetical protein